MVTKHIPTGGPAFPVEYRADAGMSLRDWFAGQALAGIYASQFFNDHAKEYCTIKQTGDHAVGAARAAYAAADAMLAEKFKAEETNAKAERETGDDPF